MNVKFASSRKEYLELTSTLTFRNKKNRPDRIVAIESEKCGITNLYWSSNIRFKQEKMSGFHYILELNMMVKVKYCLLIPIAFSV